MNLGNKLYELRKNKKMSQEEVAEKLSVTRQTISKWETDQSMPDLDKIVPLCNLYGITTDELLKGTTGKSPNSISITNTSKKERAKAISISVFLYFLSVIWICIVEPLDWINENIMVGIFLLICAVATVYLIYKMMSIPKEEGTSKIKKENPYKQIDSLVALIFTCIYLLISFLTKRWAITWLIWIVYAIVIEILHLILALKEKDYGEK